MDVDINSAEDVLKTFASNGKVLLVYFYGALKIKEIYFLNFFALTFIKSRNVYIYYKLFKVMLNFEPYCF